MHKIEIDVDTKLGYHPPRIIIRENGGPALLDMVADEFLAWIKVVTASRQRMTPRSERVMDPDELRLGKVSGA